MPVLLNLVYCTRSVLAGETLQARQGAYLAESREITATEVEVWSIGRRLWNNTLAVVSPLI